MSVEARDFTEATKEAMLERIEADIEDIKNMWSEFSDTGKPDWLSERELQQLQDAGLDVSEATLVGNDYFFFWIDFNEELEAEYERRLKQIDTVWENCHACDKDYAPKFELLYERATVLRTQLNELIDLITTGDGFFADPSKFGAQCAQIGATASNSKHEAEVQYYYNNLVNPDGTYNWDALADLMATEPPGDVSDAAIEAIARMWIDIGQNGTDEEIARNMELFFKACYIEITPSNANEDGSYTYPGGPTIPGTSPSNGGTLISVLSHVFHRVNAYIQSVAMQLELTYGTLDENGGFKFKPGLPEETRNNLEMFMLQASIMMSVALYGSAMYTDPTRNIPFPYSEDTLPIHIDFKKINDSETDSIYDYEYTLDIAATFPFSPFYDERPNDGFIRIKGTGIMSGGNIESYIDGILKDRLDSYEVPDYFGLGKMIIDLSISVLGDVTNLSWVETLMKVLGYSSSGLDFILWDKNNSGNVSLPGAGPAEVPVLDRSAAMEYADRLDEIGAYAIFSYNEDTGSFTIIVLGYQTGKAEAAYMRYRNYCSRIDATPVTSEEFIAAMLASAPSDLSEQIMRILNG